MLTNSKIRTLKPPRPPRKLFDGRELYLLVAPNGGRCWRYNYRIDGKFKTLAPGIYPDVPLAKGRVRHLLARQLLADGIDPSAVRRLLERASSPRRWRVCNPQLPTDHGCS
jgi:hypothetical protein